MPSESQYIAIGEVLSELTPDFPDVSISKIRFLETEGLITPLRAPSGYRRFTPHDVDTLRLILTAQRDRYMPLRVIKQHLNQDTLRTELGLRIAEEAQPEVEVEIIASDVDPKARFTLRETASRSGSTVELVTDLASFKVIKADESGRYTGADVLVCREFADLATRGIEPRHSQQSSLLAGRYSELVRSATQSLTGDERDEVVHSMLRSLADSLYWQMSAHINRGAPPTTYRPSRPK